MYFSIAAVFLEYNLASALLISCFMKFWYQLIWYQRSVEKVPIRNEKRCNGFSALVGDYSTRAVMHSCITTLVL